MFQQREDIDPALGRWAVMLAVLAAGFVPAAYALVALALAIGGPSERSDAWAMGLGKGAAFAGIAMVTAAFLLAGASRLRREPFESLWFPLALLPGITALGLLIYVFWVR